MKVIDQKETKVPKRMQVERTKNSGSLIESCCSRNERPKD